MYQNVTSAPTDWADSTTVEPGVIHEFKPVLCCPAAAVAVASIAMSAAIGYASGTAEASDHGSDAGDTAVAQTTYAAAYIAPGRLTYSDKPVRDDASVEKLISASDNVA